MITWPLKNHIEKSTLVLSNTWSCYHIDFNSFNFSVIHCKIHTSSCNHISFSHGTKRNAFFSDIKSSTQTSNFLRCHLLQNLASSLVSLFPRILPLSPYCFLLLCLLPPLQKLPSSCLPLKLYVFHLFFHSTGDF